VPQQLAGNQMHHRLPQQLRNVIPEIVFEDAIQKKKEKKKIFYFAADPNTFPESLTISSKFLFFPSQKLIDLLMNMWQVHFNMFHKELHSAIAQDKQNHYDPAKS
jgi:hypothetical protein